MLSNANSKTSRSCSYQFLIILIFAILLTVAPTTSSIAQGKGAIAISCLDLVKDFIDKL